MTSAVYSGCKELNQTKTPISLTDSKMDDSEDKEEEQREETPMDSSDPPAAPPAPPPHVHDADPRHYWGRGNVMEGEGQVDEGIVLVFAQH